MDSKQDILGTLGSFLPQDGRDVMPIVECWKLGSLLEVDGVLFAHRLLQLDIANGGLAMNRRLWYVQEGKKTLAHVKGTRCYAAEALQPDKPLGDGSFRQRDGGMEIQLVHNAELMKLDGLHRDVQ